MKRLTPALLLFSGLILSVIGMSVLLVPHAFFATNGITLGHDPSSMSEVRAPGGLLLASGVVLLLGVLRPGMRRHALTLAAMVFGSYGASRLLSIAIDGVPSESLLGAMGVELLLAAACTTALLLHAPAEPIRSRQRAADEARTAAAATETMGLETAGR